MPPVDLEELQARLESAKARVVHANHHNEQELQRRLDEFQLAHEAYRNALYNRYGCECRAPFGDALGPFPLRL